MGLRDAFVRLGIVTPHNCRITKNPKLGVGFLLFFFLIFTVEASVFQFKEDSSSTVAKVHQPLKGRSFSFPPKTLKSAHIGFLVPAGSTDIQGYIYINTHIHTH